MLFFLFAFPRLGTRYDELQDHTFYTKSVPLSYREAEALSRYHYSLSPNRVSESLSDEVRTHAPHTACLFLKVAR